MAVTLRPSRIFLVEKTAQLADAVNPTRRFSEQHFSKGHVSSISNLTADTLAAPIFAWLLGESVKGEGAFSEKIRATRDRGLISHAEALAIYAYAHFAAQKQSSILPRLAQIAYALAIRDEFIARCQDLNAKLSATLLEKLSAKEILSGQSPSLAQAVIKLVLAQSNSEHNRPRKRLKGLPAILFQHPSDRATLEMVRRVPFLDAITKRSVDFFKRQDEINLHGGGIKVTARSMPSIHHCFMEACEALDISPIPKLFVTNGSIGAYTTGVDDPHVVIFSGTASLLTYQELLFVLGHELGHVKCGHVLYHTVARAIKEASVVASAFTLGLAGIATDATLTPALAAWSRRSELTADRAGYLACQDEETVIRAFTKLAGFPPAYYHLIHPRNLMEQSEEFEERLAGSALDRFLSVSELWDASHPHTVLRAAEVLEWLRDGTAEDILGMNSAQLKHAAAVIDADPIQAELNCEIIKLVGLWSSENLSVPLFDARRLLRRAFCGHTSLRETKLESILQVELRMDNRGATSVQYEVVILIARGREAERVRLQLAEKSWEDIPQLHREDAIRTGSKEQNWVIYSVSG
jgi:Zn-dependent protease with chaperone function